MWRDQSTAASSRTLQARKARSASFARLASRAHRQRFDGREAAADLQREVVARQFGTPSVVAFSAHQTFDPSQDVAGGQCRREPEDRGARLAERRDLTVQFALHEVKVTFHVSPPTISLGHLSRAVYVGGRFVSK